MTWAKDAACRDTPTKVFFPTRSAGANAYAKARKLCSECPVIAECLEESMNAERSVSDRRRVGMFAGMTPQERAAYEPKWLEGRVS